MSDEEKINVWMPLFIGAYLADTQRLSTEQHGAYLLLIMDYWMNGAPPDDDEELAQITKLSLSAWKKMKAKVMKFFSLSDGRWSHKRIEKELTAAKHNKSKAVEKARAAAAARWAGKNNIPEQSSGHVHGDAMSNAPSMLQALQQGVPEGLPEGVLEQCPIPTPIPFTSLGTNTVRSEVEVGGAEDGPIRAGHLTAAMRTFGIQGNPADPRVVALVGQGVTPETVRAACEAAKRSKPHENIAVGYIISIIERWAKEAAGLQASGAKSPGRGTTQKFDPVAYVNRNRVSESHERTDDIIDV
ncbi:YdaU family protein [Paraburkholderia graminis]|uniref:YdaU family protein n=1 Tax=Paraburkholderia graminis TaxID=60548 RepID=UPI0038B83A26